MAVDPENWIRLETFLALQTQWLRDLVVGMGGGAVIWRGLDYSRVRDALAMMGLGDDPALFDDLRVMESAALEELSRR